VKIPHCDVLGDVTSLNYRRGRTHSAGGLSSASIKGFQGCFLASIREMRSMRQPVP